MSKIANWGVNVLVGLVAGVMVFGMGTFNKVDNYKTTNSPATDISMTYTYIGFAEVVDLLLVNE